MCSDNLKAKKIVYGHICPRMFLPRQGMIQQHKTQIELFD